MKMQISVMSGELRFGGRWSTGPPTCPDTHPTVAMMKQRQERSMWLIARFGEEALLDGWL